MIMKARKFLLALLLVVMCASAALAIPAAPSKGQWAYCLDDEIRLYRKADFDSRYTEVDNPGKWISAPSAVKDDDYNLWYKVKIDGVTGWLPKTGVRLKMGPKSKVAANLYDKYAKKMRRQGEKAPYTFSMTRSPDYCEEFFGDDIMGWRMSKLRKKLGTPTYRESPADDINQNILYYELADKNMTLIVTLYRDDGEEEGRVNGAMLNTGNAGAN